MDVIVDGAPANAPASAADVMGVLAEISESLHKQGRAILSVSADGQSLAPAQTAEILSGKPLDAVRRLEIVSEQTSKLVAVSLAELEAVIPDLATACHELAAVFHGTQPRTGYDPFHQLANIWSHVKERQELIAHTLGIALDSLALDGKTVGAWHTELSGFLSEAASAIQSGDTILLGDLLEYEFAPRAETEVRITGLLREKAGG